MSAAPEIAERRRILIVDDVELNRVLTEAVLCTTYDVRSVNDGHEALAALEDGRYDLVIMDLDMPGLSGHDAAAAIRRRNREPVKLVALSASGDAVSRLRSRHVGMSAHIARPIAPRVFLQEIEGVLSRLPPLAGPDPWQRHLYDEWVERLGTERMRGFLANLLDQFRSLLGLLREAAHLLHDEVHRTAHDVSSTSGMLGFTDVTGCCRGLLEAADVAAETKARPALIDALERAIQRLDGYLSANEPRAVAA